MKSIHLLSSYRARDDDFDDESFTVQLPQLFVLDIIKREVIDLPLNTEEAVRSKIFKERNALQGFLFRIPKEEDLKIHYFFFDAAMFRQPVPCISLSKKWNDLVSRKLEAYVSNISESTAKECGDTLKEFKKWCLQNGQITDLTSKCLQILNRKLCVDTMECQKQLKELEDQLKAITPTKLSDTRETSGTSDLSEVYLSSVSSFAEDQSKKIEECKRIVEQLQKKLSDTSCRVDATKASSDANKQEVERMAHHLTGFTYEVDQSRAVSTKEVTEKLTSLNEPSKQLFQDAIKNLKSLYEAHCMVERIHEKIKGIKLKINEERIKQLEDENKDLKQKIEGGKTHKECEETIKKLNQEIDDLKQKVKKGQTEEPDMKNMLDELKKIKEEKAALEEKLSESMSIIYDQQKQYADLQKMVTEIREKDKKHKESARTHKEASRTLRAENEDLRKKQQEVLEHDSFVERLKSENEDLKKKSQKALDTIKELEKKISKLEKVNRDALEQAEEGHNSLVQQLQRENQDLKSKLEETKEQLENKSSELEEVISSKEIAKTTEERLKEVEKEKESLNKQIAIRNETIEQLRLKIEELNKNVNEQSQVVRQILDNNCRLEKEAKECKSLVDSKQREIDELKQLFTAQEKEYQNRMTIIEASLRQKNNEVAELKVKLSQKDADIDRLQMELRTSESGYLKQIQDLYNELDQSRRQ